MMSEQANQSPRCQPQQGLCDECGKLAVLIPVYDQYNTDVRQRLCKACEEARTRRLEAFYEAIKDKVGVRSPNGGTLSRAATIRAFNSHIT